MSDAEIREQVGALVREVASTRQELQQVRRQQWITRAINAILLLVLIAVFTARSTTAQAPASAGRVVAPFTVVDDAGQPLFRVFSSNTGAQVRVGDKVALGVGASGTGFVVVSNNAGNDAVSLGTQSGIAGVRVFDAGGTRAVSAMTGDGATGGSLLIGGPGSGNAILRVGNKVVASEARVTIGGGDADSFAVKVNNRSGKEVAVLGEARVGGGVLVAHDAQGAIRFLMSGQGELHAVDAGGKTRATMTSEGAVSVRNASGATVVRLGEGNGGNGLMQIAGAAGNAMVEAGVTGANAGLVRAYPLGRAGGIGFLGMPGTFIVGFLGNAK